MSNNHWTPAQFTALFGVGAIAEFLIFLFVPATRWYDDPFTGGCSLIFTILTIRYFVQWRHQAGLVKRVLETKRD